jgi:hypothetical protein
MTRKHDKTEETEEFYTGRNPEFTVAICATVEASC